MDLYRFNENDVIVSNEILGKGSFGEVKLGYWKNVPIACKTLHFDEDLESVECREKFQEEISMLSQIRHPNLVLFLGACFDELNMPVMILTELMSMSLYDILEIKKIKLSFCDVVDLSMDISNGINYLHSYTPPIIHRDISSKNVLVRGNVAKISDLGQAKHFRNSGNSRQTAGIPGAMAYTAPEVLTGKYSEKLDIYSFGVLIVHMCTGIYPKIEKREEHTDLASQGAFSPLRTLLSSMLSFQPSERPSSLTVAQCLVDLRLNDKFYPVARRIMPQSEIGPIGWSYMMSELSNRCDDVSLQLRQALEHLEAEKNRWNAEAAKVDHLSGKLVEKDAQIMSLDDTISDNQLQLSLLNNDLHNYHEKVAEQSNIIVELQGKVGSYDRAVSDLEKKLLEILRENNSLHEVIEKKNDELSDLRTRMEFYQRRHEESLDTQGGLQQNLEFVRENMEETEIRLEQTLSRWKQDRSVLLEEKKKRDSIESKFAALSSEHARLQQELNISNDRLNSYKGLPSVQEIHRILKTSEIEVVEWKRKCEMEYMETNAWKEKYTTVCLEVNSIQNQLEDEKLNNQSLQSMILKLQEECKQWESKYLEKEGSCSSLQKQLALLEKDRNNTLDILEKEKAKKQTVSKILEKVRDRYDIPCLRPDFFDQLQAICNYFLTRRVAIKQTTNAVDDQLTSSETKEQEMPVDNKVDQEEGNEMVGSSENVDDVDENVRFSVGVVGSDEDKFIAHKISSFASLVGSTSQTQTRKLEMERHKRQFLAEEETQDLIRQHDLDAKALVERTKAQKGVNGLKEVLESNLEDENIQWRSFRALRELVLASENNRFECLGLYIDKLTLDGMKQHPNSMMVQSQGIRFLGNLAYGQDFARNRIGENGGLSLMVHALEKYGESEEQIVLNTFTALTNICHHNPGNCNRCLDAGGLEIILMLASCAKYQSSPKFNRQLCWLLLTLAHDDPACQSLMQGGAASVLISAMNCFRFERDVQLYGCWCLENLAISGDDIKRKLKKSGAVEVCKLAGENHEHDEEVAKRSKHALGALGPITKLHIPGKK